MTQLQEVTTLQESLSPNNSPAPAALDMPRETDGASIHNLVRRSAFLDNNSLYCYLMVCHHLARTSVVARIDGELSGVITAYVPPEQPDTLFVWQVAVAKHAQRRGLAKAMLDNILQRDNLQHIKWVETTVTKDNNASRSLFDSLARRRECEIEESTLFDRKKHFRNLHNSEFKLRIGPLSK